jgi:Tol biopolymer transport system component
MLVSVACTPAAQATFPGRNGKIVGQTSYRADPYDAVHHAVVTINPDGSGRAVINTSESGRAIASPNGARIAFQRGLPNGCCFYTPDIATMNPDGTGIFTVAIDGNPPGLVQMGLESWAPDGTRLLFSNVVCHRCQQPEDGLWTISPDGSAPRRVSDDRTSYYGSWSPDASRIAYASDTGLYVVNAAGGPPRKLVAGGGIVPAWSPRGNAIAYVSGTDLSRIGVNGRHNVRLVHADSLLGVPQWSPDAKQLLFDTAGAIYEVRSNGARLKRLADGSGPIWSPDGRKIAFTGPAGGIWAMKADGSAQARLTDPSMRDIVTDWQPIPGRHPRRAGASRGP